MPSITVVVQEIDQNPRPGAKTGGVKGTDGAWYKVPLNMMGMVQPGGTYNFFYEDSTFNNKVYHMVKTINAAQQQLPIQHPAQQAPQYAPQQQYAAPPQQPMPQQAAPRMAAPPPFVPNREEQIFVCGALNAAIHSAQVNIYGDEASTIAEVVQKLQTVWRLTLGNPNAVLLKPNNSQPPQRQASAPPSQRGDDMSDAIPFN